MLAGYGGWVSKPKFRYGRPYAGLRIVPVGGASGPPFLKKECQAIVLASSAVVTIQWEPVTGEEDRELLIRRKPEAGRERDRLIPCGSGQGGGIETEPIQAGGPVVENPAGGDDRLVGDSQGMSRQCECDRGGADDGAQRGMQ